MADDEEIALEDEAEEEVADEEEDAAEEEPEEEPEEAPKPPPKKEEPTPEEVIEEPKQLKRAPKTQKDGAPKEMTEAEIAIQEAKMRHEEEAEARMKEYEEKRKAEKEAMEQELNELKEKKEQRERERREMEEQMAERARKAEEHRRQDEAEMLARKEAAKLKEDQQKKKRQAKLTGYLAGANVDKGAPPNYVITKKSGDKPPAFGAGNQANASNEAQKEESKKNFLAALMRRKFDPTALLDNDLKTQILNLHKQICKLQAEKYDLEKRQQSQEYDLKELHEREKQAARNKAIKKGLDPNEAVQSCHPPKIYVASKHDRQVDSRSYGDRRTLYENARLPPPPKVARGTPRPPPEWGRRCTNEELEQIRKNLGPHKYTEEVPIDAKPPVPYKPLQLPKEDEVEEEHGAEEEEGKKGGKGSRDKEASKVLKLEEPQEIITEGQDTSEAFTLKLK